MSTETTEPAGDLATALTHTARLLADRPAMAEAQAREILKVMPGQPDALLLLAAARRGQGQAADARAIAEPLAAARADWAPAQLELGLILAAQGQSRAAVRVLKRAVRLDPRLSHAWRALDEQLTLMGDERGARDAQARHMQASVNDPVLLQAASALVANDLPTAERLLRGFLKANPTEATAIRMLAETGARLGRYDDAEALLERCLELAPGFTAARRDLATVLHRQNKPVEAIALIDALLAAEPGNPGYRSLKGAALTRIGDFAQAIELYESVLAAHPDQPKAWMSYGHALKTVGRLDDAVAAYRRSIDLKPGLGEAWWSLANLKTVRFTAADVALMQAELDGEEIDEEDRFHLHFALGKALEDEAEFEPSFAHYLQANAQRRRSLPYDPDDISARVRRAKALFTPDFLAARAGQGSQARDPIFILGLPRAGSTLIEQILSSHSQVEGVAELADIIAIARRLAGPGRGQASAYPDSIADLDAAALRALGEEYLDRTRVQRQTARPLFIDKMPNNWAHLGLIHLILPNATIIDARRHPMGCCFSGFKQHFARGQAFTYGLADIGRYYADYVELMAHFDAVLPGRVHRVLHEDMVADPEGQVRALLAHCGLEFEDACLRFYETDRAVRTASSEQVRRPINAEGVDHWKNYEPWLDELKAALGPVLDAYPAAPA